MLTGHTLGAAGAIEAALCCLLMELDWPCLIRGRAGSRPAPIALVQAGVASGRGRPVVRVLSNSFAFGGNNASLLLGRTVPIDQGKEA